MKMEITYEDLKHLISEESKAKKKDTISISKKQLLEGLEKNEKEVLEKFNQSLKLWRQAIKMYQRFLKEAPGSKQMKGPGEMPSLPEAYQELKNWYRLIESFVGETLELELAVLKEIFKISTQAVTEARATRDSYLAANAGTYSPYIGSVS